MDIKKCQLFSITAETENISKAAELTGYTQSGVSHMLKNFEEEVGIQLLRRDRYGVHLTPVGANLLPYVRSLLSEHERLEQYINDLHGLEVGSLTIGTFSSVSIHWLPPILDQFQKEHPHIDIRLKEGGIQDIEQWILNHEVDLAFYSQQPEHSFQFIHIQNDPIVAVLPKDYEIEPGTTAFPIHKFDHAPFIISEMDVDSDVSRVIRKSKIKPEIRFSSKDDYAIMSMVEHHLGLSILPELIIKGRINDLLTLPLSPPFYRDLGIGLNDILQATPIAKTFIQFIQDYFRGETG